jgi:hypothetical protein
MGGGGPPLRCPYTNAPVTVLRGSRQVCHHQVRDSVGRLAVCVDGRHVDPEQPAGDADGAGVGAAAAGEVASAAAFRVPSELPSALAERPADGDGVRLAGGMRLD